MFQFRWLNRVQDAGIRQGEMVLQWRTRLVGVPGNSAYVINAWSDWVDVPTVAVSDKADKE